MRVLGIDYGNARIGIAMGDTETCIAGPLTVLENHGDDRSIIAIQELIKKEQIEKIIVGLPLGKEGEETEQSKRIRSFISKLEEIGMIIETINERFTSQIALHHVHERGEKGKRDDLAASAILQSWLDTVSSR